MLICDLKSKNIEKYEVDGLIINSSEYSVFNDTTFSVDEIEEIVYLIHKANKKAYLQIDKVIEEDEIDNFEKYLKHVSKFNFDGYFFSDFGVLSLLKEEHISGKYIYDAKTMITNYYDALFYQKLNVDVVVANELTLEDIKDIARANNSIIEVYGYHQIFYSRRKLFDSYEKYKNTNFNLKNKLNYIKEEFRQELYPIYQSDKGTFIYNAKVFKLFHEVKSFYDSLKAIKINSMFIDENTLFMVIWLYNQMLNVNDAEQINELERKLEALNPNFTNGFLYNKSVLLKEDE